MNDCSLVFCCHIFASTYALYRCGGFHYMRSLLAIGVVLSKMQWREGDHFRSTMGQRHSYGKWLHFQSQKQKNAQNVRRAVDRVI